METITAIVACAVAFALAFYVGYGRAPSTLIAAMLGAVSGIGFAVVFFVMTVAVAMMLPGTFAPRSLGVHFIGLLAVAPLGAAVIAVLAQRRAMTKMHF